MKTVNQLNEKKTAQVLKGNRFWRWMKLIFKWLGLLLLVLALLGAIFQFVTTRINDKSYPPPGKLVDVGGYRLHLRSAGNGGPTVVMDAGLGGASISWSLVQPEIAKFTTVCTYDRAGMGWSDVGPRPRTSQQIVKELHTLLRNGGIKKPYVLVGHSSGGFNMLLYARQYPDEVAGLVLVDASHERQLERFPNPPLPDRILKKMMPYLYKILPPLGVGHLVMREKPDPRLPPAVREMNEAVRLRSQTANTAADELLSLEESFAQFSSVPEMLGDMPLIVLSRGKKWLTPGMSAELNKQYDQVWNELQADHAARSRNGIRIIAEKSGHFIQKDQPELVIDAVRRVVEAVRAR